MVDFTRVGNEPLELNLNPSAPAVVTRLRKRSQKRTRLLDDLVLARRRAQAAMAAHVRNQADETADRELLLRKVKGSSDVRLAR